MQKCVAFFPSIQEMAVNPYWLILESELEKTGVHSMRGTPQAFSVRWLVQNRKRVDVLHMHFIRPFYGTSQPGRIRTIYVLWFGIKLLLARLLGFCLVFTLHDLESGFNVEPAWADRLGHAMAVNISHRVIVHCEEARRLLAQKYGRRRNVFTADHPHFIGWYPNRITKEAARRRLNLTPDAVVFTFLGGIRPNKGIETLIQAFRGLRDNRFRLVIAGKANRPEAYAESLKILAEGDDRISMYLEHILDDEIQVFMNAADIAVLPFAKILTSSSTVLAMSFGLPVIVPATGCLPALVAPDAGWLFEPNDPASLAEAMHLAATCDFQQSGKHAFERISCCSPKQFAEQTVRAYWE